MSFGVAEKSAGQNSEEVLRASDIALYAAKGRPQPRRNLLAIERGIFVIRVQHPC